MLPRSLSLVIALFGSIRCAGSDTTSALPAIAHLVHSASGFANSTLERLRIEKADVTGSVGGVTSQHANVDSSAAAGGAPSLAASYAAGIRSLSQLNEWSGDTLMAECYGKANVWLRPEDPIGGSSSSGGGGSGGIASLDIVSRTQMSVGLSRDLVKLQQAYTRAYRAALAVIAARGRVVARMLIDMPTAARAIDLASWGVPQSQPGGIGSRGSGDDGTSVHQRIVTAAQLGLTPQHTRSLSSLLTSIDTLLLAAASSAEAQLAFHSTAASIYQRVNVSVGMCAGRWHMRASNDISNGARPTIMATPHAHTVVSMNVGSDGRPTTATGGLASQGDGDGTYADIFAAAGDADSGALAARDQSHAHQHRTGSASGVAAVAQSSARRPTDSSDMLVLAEDAVAAAEGMRDAAAGRPVAIACKLRAIMLTAVSPLGTAANSTSGSSGGSTSSARGSGAGAADAVVGSVASASSSAAAVEHYCASAVSQLDGASAAAAGAHSETEEAVDDGGDTADSAGRGVDNSTAVLTWWSSFVLPGAASNSIDVDAASLAQFCAAVLTGNPAATDASACVGQAALNTVLAPISKQLREAHSLADSGSSGAGGSGGDHHLHHQAPQHRVRFSDPR